MYFDIVLIFSPQIICAILRTLIGTPKPPEIFRRVEFSVDLLRSSLLIYITFSSANLTFWGRDLALTHLVVVATLCWPRYNMKQHLAFSKLNLSYMHAHSLRTFQPGYCSRCVLLTPPHIKLASFKTHRIWESLSLVHIYIGNLYTLCICYDVWHVYWLACVVTIARL